MRSQQRKCDHRFSGFSNKLKRSLQPSADDLLDFAFCSLRYWVMITSKDNRLSCEAIAWTHDGPQLSRDEQHAFRYEVRDANGVVGFINTDTDRARPHPEVRCVRELLREGKIEKLRGTYANVSEALAAF